MPIGRPNDESKLSRNPRQIRNRLRRRTQFMERDAEMLYEKSLDEWDIEELSRGKPRAKDGTFRGPTPRWITPLVAVEAKRRMLDHAIGALAGHLDQAIVTMGNLLTNEDVDDKGRPIVDAKTKYAAAAFIIEHLIGKPKALIEVDDKRDETKHVLASAIVLDDGQPQGHLLAIEGEIVEDDEEPEDDDA
jgi:hypothetical protein